MFLVYFVGFGNIYSFISLRNVFYRVQTRLARSDFFSSFLNCFRRSFFFHFFYVRGHFFFRGYLPGAKSFFTIFVGFLRQRRYFLAILRLSLLGDLTLITPYPLTLYERCLAFVKWTHKIFILRDI